MLPFKPLLSPKTRFQWLDDLDEAFTKSKEEIIQAIKEGVSISGPKKPTCLGLDWSTSGIVFFLGQKHCECRGESWLLQEWLENNVSRITVPKAV